MAETYGPFDGVPWSQGQWYDYAPTWAPSGVIGAPAASYNVGELALAVNGLNLTLGTGRAWVRGAGYKNDAGKAFTVDPNANASLSRRDRIVLRRDLAAKTVTAIRLVGTPASQPQNPTLQRNDAGQWDLPLFSFLVPPNSGTTLTDIRGERGWADASGRLHTVAPIETGAAADIGAPLAQNSIRGLHASVTITRPFGAETPFRGKVTVFARVQIEAGSEARLAALGDPNDVLNVAGEQNAGSVAESRTLMVIDTFDSGTSDTFTFQPILRSQTGTTTPSADGRFSYSIAEIEPKAL